MCRRPGPSGHATKEYRQTFLVPLYALQVASIMGAGFSVGLLAAVHPMASSCAHLEADLQALAAARFLRPDDAAPGAWAWCQVLPGTPRAFDLSHTLKT